ncbi:MAG: hypothetical protein ACI9X4_001003 [Glaciecola sp.]|jgi:hypothetical protein
MTLVSDPDESKMLGGPLNPREELGEAMAEFAPDLRLLDRGWLLEGDSEIESDFDSETASADELTVDWVAVDASGRINLLLWMGADGDAIPSDPVELALEVLHRAQNQIPFILAHLGNCGIRPDLAPRLILAAEHFSASIVRKLGVLGEDRMRLVEVHEVRTASGVSHHLVLRWPEKQNSEPVGPLVFMERLPDSLRATAEIVLQRLDHVDERVIYGGMGIEYLEWGLRGHTLCALQYRDGQLLASVSGGESSELTDEPSAEAFIEVVLQRYFEILEEKPVGGDEDGKSLVDQGLGVVLSHEELDAFL